MSDKIENISFDAESTRSIYSNSKNSICNHVLKSFLPMIANAFSRNSINLGIDLEKPWEEKEMEDFYQVEYIFKDQLLNGNSVYIKNDDIGINIFKESIFGSDEFGTDQVLKLTLIINK